MAYITYNGKYATIGGKYAILGGGAAPGPSYPTDGLLARYDFDYNYNDSYGNYDIPETYSNDFITPGIYRTKFAEGLNGKGCVKSSSTIGAVISPILASDLAGGRKTYTLVFWMNLGGATNLSTPGWTDEEKLGIYVSSGKASAFRYDTFYRTSQTPVAVNTGWHMFLHSYDGTNLRFNMDNGKYNYTKAFLTQPLNPYYAMHGLINGNTGAGIQYSYIYNRAITDEEIAILWNGGAGL